MYNHARTLLLNRASTGINYPGDELVPPLFRPVALPTAVNTVRSILFGATPDWYMMNYRLRQLLAVLHSSPLLDYALALDPRITYPVSGTEDFVPPSLYTPTIVRTSGAVADKLFIVGAPSIPDPSGRMFSSFQVQPTGIYTLEVNRTTTPTQEAFFDYTLDAGGVSAPLPLAGSGYSAVVNTNNPGASWLITILNRPQYDLGQLVASLDQVGDATLIAVLGTGVNVTEPFPTCSNLWNNQTETPLRLAAMLTAIVYCTEAARTNSG